MLHTDARFHSAVEDAVGRLEALTDAEIIVVAAPRSGSYRDVSLIAATLVTFAMLLVLLLVPFAVHPWMLPIELGVTFAAAAWVASGTWFLRWLVPASRRADQVTEAAHAEFHREQVHATPHRTGVLVYVSALEGKVVVMPDLGIEGRVPAVPWEQACAAFSHQDLDHFLGALDGLGALLAEHVPPLHTDLVDLPNAPRVRS